jgi:hypothetical protein
MAFELFTSSRSPASESFISLVKEGFRLSAGFVRTYHLERVTAVQLYFDRAKHAVAFRFPTGSQPRDGALKPKRHAGGLVIRGESFFRSRSINPGTYAGRYSPHEVKDGRIGTLYVIQLHAQSKGQHKRAAA